MWITLGWLALVLAHTPPAIAAVSPAWRRRMYGVEENPQLGLILAHRGVLFLAVAVICLYAAFVPGARPSATIVAAISLFGFLVLYAAARAPKGRLRAIALIDLVALVPLAAVTADAWGAAV